MSYLSFFAFVSTYGALCYFIGCWRTESRIAEEIENQLREIEQCD